jgi:hypothetical protein
MFAKHAANVIIATAMISVFIGVFFFTYASKIEQDIVVKRTTEIVDSMVSSAQIIPPSEKALISTQIAPNLTIPASLEQQDAEVAAANKQLMIYAAKAIAIFVSICVIVVGCLVYYYKLPLGELIQNNLIILVFVALTEFIFLTFFAQNYITIDGNYVKKTVVESLISFGGGK